VGWRREGYQGGKIVTNFSAKHSGISEPLYIPVRWQIKIRHEEEEEKKSSKY